MGGASLNTLILMSIRRCSSPPGYGWSIGKDIAMADFDIDSLLQFNPQRYLCEKCCALNVPQPSFKDDDQLIYPVCDVH